MDTDTQKQIGGIYTVKQSKSPSLPQIAIHIS